MFIGMFVYYKYRGSNILQYTHEPVKHLRSFGDNEGCLKMEVLKAHSPMYNAIWITINIMVS